MHRDVCFVARRAHSARTAQSSTQVDSKRPAEAWHTVAIWTFTFHKIFGFERVILKVKFNPIYRQKLSIFLSEKSDLLNSFFFYFSQNLSNPVLFTHCCCYSKELTCLNCNLMQKSQFKHVNSLE